MANALNRNLKIGDKLVMSNGDVAVIDSEMFGCASFTSGTAIGVTIYGRSVRANGYDIDAKATVEKFGKENGWTEPDAPSTTA